MYRQLTAVGRSPALLFLPVCGAGALKNCDLVLPARTGA
jgi:hypothetical protein